MDRRTLGLVIAVLAVGVLLPKDQRTSAQAPDTAAALLVEVRGLRAALEQLASAGPRVQLLFGRLQLQEQRISGQVRRLETLGDRTRSAAREVQQLTESITQLEAEQKTADPEHRERLEGILRDARPDLARARATLNALRTEEATINNDIAVEQGRWTEINQRLEELEKILTKR